MPSPLTSSALQRLPAMPVRPVAEIVASLLGTVADDGADAPGQGAHALYDAEAVPDVPLADYIECWALRTETGPSQIIAAVLYVDRVCSAARLRLTWRNVHRVVLASLLCATKFQEDGAPFRMGYYAEVGGVDIEELARLERCFLVDIEWRLCVDGRTAERYMSMIRRNPAWQRVVQHSPPPRTARSARSHDSGSQGASSCGMSSEGMSTATSVPASSKGADGPSSKMRRWFSKFSKSETKVSRTASDKKTPQSKP